MKKLLATGLAATMVVLMAACAQPQPGSENVGNGSGSATQTSVATTADDVTSSSAAGSVSNDDLISEEEAKDIVLERLADPDNAEFLEFKLDDDDDDGDDDIEYEGYVRDGDIVYEFEVDARTGEIDEWDVEDDYSGRTTVASNTSSQNSGSDQLISEDEAKDIVLERLADPDNAEFLEFKLDDDDDDGDDDIEYEGKVRDGDTVYEFEIDALTGTVDEWEIDD